VAYTVKQFLELRERTRAENQKEAERTRLEREQKEDAYYAELSDVLEQYPAGVPGCVRYGSRT